MSPDRTADDGRELPVRDGTPDDREGAAQARTLLRAVRRSGVEPHEVWFRCFTLGGEVGPVEVDAYLHGCLWLPPAERALLARAVSELVGGPPPRGGGPRPADRC